jgi:peptide/nickel transport system permease protein
MFFIFSALALLLISFSVLAPYIAPHDPVKTNLFDALQDPSPKYPLGTDQLGRCLLSRILYGAMISLKMTFYLVFVVFTVGVAAGTAAGYWGGIADGIIMRFTDIFLAFPGIILAIAIAGILGTGLMNTIIALAAVGWTKYARVSRILVLSVKEKEYIAAAKMGGAKPYGIIIKHVLPNIIPSLIVMAVMDIGVMMLEIAALSFLGLGAQPPTPEWGYMLNEGRNYLQTAPWLMIYPGMAILITVAIFNLLGDSLRDILDPNQKMITWRSER